MSAVTQTTIGDFDTQSMGFDDGGLHKTSARWRLFNKARASAREWYWSAYDQSEYTCPVCGVHSRNTTMHVHHRDGDPLNNHPLNLIAICARCHRLEHRRRHTSQRIREWKRAYSDLFQEDVVREDIAVIGI